MNVHLQKSRVCKLNNGCVYIKKRGGLKKYKRVKTSRSRFIDLELDVNAFLGTSHVIIWRSGLCHRGKT